MADRAKKISELDAHSNPAANNLLVIVDNPGLANSATKKITLNNLFGNVSCNVVITGDKLQMPDTTAPTSPTSEGSKGEIRFDPQYLYICVTANTWVRTSLSSW